MGLCNSLHPLYYIYVCVAGGTSFLSVVECTEESTDSWDTERLECAEELRCVLSNEVYYACVI